MFPYNIAAKFTDLPTTMYRLHYLLIILSQCILIVQNKSMPRKGKFVPLEYDPLLASHDKNYHHPNYGYEPYWPHGEWIIKDPYEGSRTTVPTVCGDECNYLYRKIGHVCAHRADNMFFDGCWYLIETIWFYCTAERLDSRVKGYVTFDSYCKFLDAKCHAPLKEKYGLVHFGKCLEDQKDMYKGINVASDIVSRMTAYLASLGVTKK